MTENVVMRKPATEIHNGAGNASTISDGYIYAGRMDYGT